MTRVLQALGALALFVVVHASLAWALVRPHLVGVAPAVIERAATRPGHASLLFLGDTGLGDAGQAVLDAEGYDAPLRPTIDLVQAADVAIANLEMPITTDRVHARIYKEWRYASDPRAAGALASAGLDIALLANNHALDQGALGMLDTIDALRRVGIEPMGGGVEEQARRGVVMRVGDVRIGLLDYCEEKPWWLLGDDQFARKTHVGAAALTEQGLADDLRRLRPLVDLAVVSLHVGVNYAPPDEATLRWSQRAIELGADLVVDHHPHVAHPLALYKGRPIALSIGNYAFNTPGGETLDFGEMLFVEVDGKRIARLEVLPIDVQNDRVGFKPRPLRGPHLDATLRTIIDGSAQRGAHLRRVDDRAVLEVAPW